MEEKEEYLIRALMDKSQIGMIAQRLKSIVTDSDFYKFDLLEVIVDKLIENGYEQTVLENFLLLLRVSLPGETMNIINNVALLPEGKTILKDNLELIYKKIDGEDILEFVDLLDEEEKNRIKQRNSYAYYLYDENLIGGNSLGSIIKSDMSIFVEEIIKEVSNGQKLEKLEPGAYSDVIKTNGYVIKIGETRDKYEMPYHPNILQPLLRERIQDEMGNNILVVEVQDIVDVENVTDEQRKKLEEILKRAKIKCVDMKDDNIGILIKPNKRRLFNGVGGVIDHDDIEEETLPPGEPVILDTDMIEKEEK